MLTWIRNYRLFKHAQETLKGTRKLLRMHRDILPAEQCVATGSAADELAAVLKSKDAGRVAGLLDKLESQLERKIGRAHV